MKRYAVLCMAFFVQPLFLSVPGFTDTRGGATMKIELSSPAFKQGGSIPAAYTCDGNDGSPALAWKGAPAGVKSFALICDDPDAPGGTWVHWVMYNIPPKTTSLPESVPASKTLGDGSMQGVNDFRKIGYGGPCPPGGTHRYFFKVYALDAMLNLGPGATKAALLKAMDGHIIGQGELVGAYSRR